MNYLNIRRPTCIVFGDIILDVQLHGSIKRIANEAPIPILHFKSRKEDLGGCGNVLINLESMNCDTLFLFSMIGDDVNGQTIKNILGKYPTIRPHLYSSESYTTTVKTRAFSNNKIVFRYDVEKKIRLIDEHAIQIQEHLSKIIQENKIDSIILSDYNNGFLTKTLTQYIIRTARENGIPTFVDPKVDYTKYIGCTIYKPNIKELKDIFNIDFAFENLKEILSTVQERVGSEGTLLTLSEQGMSFLTDTRELLYENTNPTEVNDVTGAGDIVIAILAYYYKTMKDRDVIRLATWLGTHSVKFMGTYVVKRSDILEAFKCINKTKYTSVESLQNLQGSIVFTNGCFDIVHEGHIALFKYCKSIKGAGGSVVVALNSDSSVKGLKGPKRPINNLQARIALLNQFETIDWIVSFDELTPYNLLKTLRPSVLVKGGDYLAEALLGREFCGKVDIFKYMDGKSSTNIINAIQSQGKDDLFMSTWRHPNPCSPFGKDCFLMMDLDGTIIDTDRVHFNAYSDSLREMGIAVGWEEFELASNNSSIEELFFKLGLPRDELQTLRNLKFEKLVQTAEIHPIVGAEEFVRSCLANSVNMVVVTNTSRKVVEFFKTKVQFLNLIENWVCREDYGRPKPDSECYKKAYETYYTGEKYTIGFENTLNGFTAIKETAEYVYFITHRSYSNYGAIRNESAYLIENYNHFI